MHQAAPLGQQRPIPATLRLIVERWTPTTASPGVGPDVAAQLLTTPGDSPDRLHSEAALAHCCGATPIRQAPGRRVQAIAARMDSPPSSATACSL